MAKTLDLDNNGQIEYTEFLAGLAEHCTLQFEDALWAIFCKYDTDRSGFIDITELKAMLQQWHFEHSRHEPIEEVAHRLMVRMDVGGDEQISFDDLCSYLLSDS